MTCQSAAPDSSEVRHLHAPGEAPGEAGADSPCLPLQSQISILHINVQSLMGHHAFLQGVLDIHCPTLLAVNESWLDVSHDSIVFAGYTLVSRRDRSTHPNRGGVCLFVHSLYNCVCLLEHSPVLELSWHVLYSDLGPLLLGIWYRPPSNEDQIGIFEAEWQRHSVEAVGTIIVGDLNVHHSSWLHFSNGNSRVGQHLFEFCRSFGFKECVRAPTRGPYLLDLALSDLHEYLDCKLLAPVADHNCVFLTVSIALPEPQVVTRMVLAFW